MNIPKFRMLDDGLMPCDMCGKDVEVRTTRKVKGEETDLDFVCMTCFERFERGEGDI